MPTSLLFKNIEAVPNIKSGLEKDVKHNILVASYLLIFPSNKSSFVYFAFAGFPEIILIKNMKDVIPLILNNLFIIFLNKQPINSGKPHLIKMFDNTKKGNNDGKMLFLKMFKEKSTAFNMLSDFVNISNPINIKIIMINMLVIFFTFAPLK